MPEAKVDPDKYIVFKRQELIEALMLHENIDHELLDSILELLNKLSLNDAYVLRQRDWCAVGGLYAYANHVRTVAETLEEFGDPFSQKKVSGLHAIADHAMGVAEGAAQQERRLPTL